MSRSQILSHIDRARARRPSRCLLLILALFAPAYVAAQPQIHITPFPSDTSGATQNTWAPVVFQVTNTGSYGAYVNVTPNCGPFAGYSDPNQDPENPEHVQCGLHEGVSSFLVQPGQTGNVQVWVFTGPGLTRGPIKLIGTWWNGSANHTDTATMQFSAPREVPAGSIHVTPKGTVSSQGPESQGNVSFTITAPTVLLSVKLECGYFSAFEVPCSLNYGGNSYAAGSWFGFYPATFSNTFATGTSQPIRSPIRVIAKALDPFTNNWVIDTGYVTVAVGPQVIPVITPHAATRTVIPAAVRADTFIVRNAGNTTGTYTFSPSCGAFTGCAVSPTTATLMPDSTVKAIVSYTTSGNGTASTIRLIASGVYTYAAMSAPPQVDTARIAATANDAASPQVTITPTQDSVTQQRTITVVVGACDADGLLDPPTVTFNGSTLPPMFLRTTQTGCASAGTSTFQMLAVPGTNTVTASISDRYHTTNLTHTFAYDDASNVTPIVAAFITPTRVTPSVAWADTFTVKNPGPVSAAYTFTASCGSFSNCTAPAQQTIAAGATVKVVVGYNAPAAGASATIQLTATHVSATNHSVNASASLTATTTAGAFPQVSFTPANGASYSGPQITATVSWCDADDAIASHQVWLGGVLLPDTYVATTQAGCASAGTSTWTDLLLKPWAQELLVRATDAAGHVTSVGHTITYAASLGAFAPRVTPKGMSAKKDRGTVSTQRFVIENTGAYNAVYELTASCGSFTVCQAAASTLALAPGARDSVAVSFLMPTAIGSFSPVRLVARYRNEAGETIADSGQVTVSTPSAFDLYQPLVTSAVSSLIIMAPGYAAGGSFNIKNTGSESVTYTLATTATAGYGFDIWAMPPTSIQLAPGQAQWINFNVRAPGGDHVTGNVTVAASYLAADGTTVTSSDYMTYTTFSNQTRGVIVTPKDLIANDSRSSPFHLTGFGVGNTGNVSNDFQYSVTCSGFVINCKFFPSNATTSGTTLAAGASNENILVRYDIAPAGLPGGSQGSLKLVAQTVFGSPIARDSATIVVHLDGVALKAVSVTPASAGPLEVPKNTKASWTFGVKNRGDSAATYAYQVTCAPAATFTSCAPAAGTTAAIAPGQSASVLVEYKTANSDGLTGTVTLRAVDISDDSVYALGVLNVRTAPIAPLRIWAKDLNPGRSVPRDQCLTVAVGDDAAYECADVRLVHPLPATTTMSRTRAPTLIYNSRYAQPIPLVAADVAVAPGTEPAVLTATLSVANHTSAVRSFMWTGTNWSNGAKHRLVVDGPELALTTGTYTYVLQVQAWSQSQTLLATAADTGFVTVVDRSTSPFGAGWWVDGVEQLAIGATVPDTSKRLWIGGDGSTRLYVKQGSSGGTTTWLVDPTLDRPDTLTLTSGVYTRHLRNGARVQFNAAGQQTATINALGHTTTFAYSGSNLGTITLPVPAGSSATPTYTFTYTSGYLSSVTAPPIGSVARQTVLLDSTGTAGHRLVKRITDPDTHSVVFRHDTKDRVTARVDRRNNVTSFVYDTASTLRSATREMGSPELDIRHTFCPTQTASISWCARGLVDSASVLTWVDGPRSDVGDTTRFVLTRFGAPAAITNALRHTTTIERADEKWPLLATAVVQPNGHRVQMFYDAGRALPLVTTDVAPFGGASAPTTNTWHSKWDVATTVVGPTGQSTSMGYDDTYPLRLWQQVGGGDTTRAYFWYNARRQLDSTLAPGNSGSQKDYLVYETVLGNLSQATSPTGAVTTYRTDAVGRVDSTASTIGGGLKRSQTTQYDLMDRARVQRDIGPAVSYSLNGGPNRTAPAVTLVVTNDYDNEGNLLSVTRQSQPAITNGAAAILSWSYDAAHRRITGSNSYAESEAWAYDPAGNMKTWTTRRGKTVSSTYDALSRPATRTTQQVKYAPEVRGLPPELRQYWNFDSFAKFPHFGPSGFMYDWIAAPSVTPDSLVIVADVASFTYDSTGNLETAFNYDARVHRTYYPNGALKTDSLAVAVVDVAETPTSTPFAHHGYSLAYTYDLSGRRTSRTDRFPGCTPCVQTYHYEPVAGLLDSTSDRGATFGFGYDRVGRMKTRVSRVNGSNVVEESFGYDAESRLTRRHVGSIYDDSLTYDHAGRILTALVSSTIGALNDNTQQVYNGLGALAGMKRVRGSTTLIDDYVPDAFGNPAWHYRLADGARDTNYYHYNGDRLFSISQTAGGGIGAPAPLVQSIDTTENSYDSGGNRTRTTRYMARYVTSATNWAPQNKDREWTWNAYSADDKLRVSQRSFFENDVTLRTVFSEFRYDALGRRVLTRTRWDQYCNPNPQTGHCLSMIERAIWDGDQMLTELRNVNYHVVGDSTLSPCEPDWDMNLPECNPQSQQVPRYTQNGAGWGLETEYTTGAFSGWIRYTHAGGIDEPLAVWKNDFQAGLVPHRSWRGVYEGGTFLGSTNVNPSWPGRNADAFRSPDVRLQPIEPTHWMGSVVDGAGNPSGLTYLRNRYYDPKSGRFTQEDPIGLAGGMNLYGFADGDPVNFSDPFGLCKDANGVERGGDFCPGGQGLKSAGLLDPIAWLSGGIGAWIERGLAALGARVVAGAGSRVAANKIAGDAFRDEIADAFGSNGYAVAKEVGKKTPFGRRVIDVEVSKNGEVLGGIEAKAGKSRYLPWQMAKDEYLRRAGYPVQVVRDATAVKVSGIPK